MSKSPKRFRRLLASLLLAAASLPLASAASAASAASDLELRVKAAVLFNFAKFVTWPSSKLPTPDAPIRLCVIDPDPFGSILDDTVRGKLIDGHPVIVERSRDASALSDCHIAYVPSEVSSAKFTADLSQLSGHSVLTVHEEDAAMPDGAIRLLIDDRRLRFEINTAAVEQEKLQISSKLLGLAILVSR